MLSPLRQVVHLFLAAAADALTAVEVSVHYCSSSHYHASDCYTMTVNFVENTVLIVRFFSLCLRREEAGRCDVQGFGGPKVLTP